MQVQKPKALYGQPFASAYFQQNTTPHKVDQPQVNRDHEFDVSDLTLFGGTLSEEFFNLINLQIILINKNARKLR